MKKEEKKFLYSICEEIMPYMPIKKRTESFALMMRDGESITPSQISGICERTGLSPIFITCSLGGELDISRRYARSLGAPLALPRCGAAVTELLSACNFSICESEESAILSISARVPAYLSASRAPCRSFAAQLFAKGISGEVIIPYTKNRTGAISTRKPHENDLSQAIEVLRSVIF